MLIRLSISGLTIFHWKITGTDIIPQIDFAIKREGYEMSFETMVLDRK